MIEGQGNERCSLKYLGVESDYESEICRISRLILEKKTDTERWQKQQSVWHKWEVRTRRIGKMIPGGCSVLDLGCGDRKLKEFIPEDCTYTGADLVARTDDTLFLEINDDIWPDGQWDVVVAAGVLEYVYDVKRFFERVRQRSGRLIFTYHVDNVSGDVARLKRLESGWLSDFRFSELVICWESSGWNVASVTGLAKKEIFRQYIFELESV
ncbi:methyltransferase domain-containing protein [Parathalassolituus penaei]|uniref:Uncharacterized protein n=1 Tax=Parathalassolituus penaei TaxID=2997323 RepID=A0A9X3EF58_9GAMM|nr:methyltransferase domain-containing protein [Parathalassolituus penaei]MCY0966452.1 hypothetical protein [Parathalassolituus penaei]